MNAVTGFVLLAEPKASVPPGSWPGSFPSQLEILYGVERGESGVQSAGQRQEPEGEAGAPGFTLDERGRLTATVAPSADPFAGAVLSLLAAPTPLRWVAMSIGGDGEPAALESADLEMDRARLANATIVVRTGDEFVDGLLDDILPALADALGDLTGHQKEVVRLALLDGLRQTQVAARFEISRATVSIAFERAHVRSLGRLLGAVRRLVGSARPA